MKRFAIVVVVALVALTGIAAIAGAFSEGERSDGGSPAITQPSGPHVTGVTAQKAGAAALRASGGGTVIAVTRDTTGGAAYIVQVNQPDGDIAQVRVDRNCSPVGIDTLQSDGGDGGD